MPVREGRCYRSALSLPLQKESGGGATGWLANCQASRRAAAERSGSSCGKGRGDHRDLSLSRVAAGFCLLPACFVLK